MFLDRRLLNAQAAFAALTERAASRQTLETPSGGLLCVWLCLTEGAEERSVEFIVVAFRHSLRAPARRQVPAAAPRVAPRKRP